MRSRRAIVVVVAASPLLLAVPRAPAQTPECRGDARIPTANTTALAALALVCDINNVRASNGLRALRLDTRLRFVAKALAEGMARTDTFSHIDRSGRDLDERVAATTYLRGHPGGVVLETIAWGQDEYATPRSILESWMESDSHREKLLDPSVTDIGLAAAVGDGAYYVADFGSRGSLRAACKAQRRVRAGCRR